MWNQLYSCLIIFLLFIAVTAQSQTAINAASAVSATNKGQVTASIGSPIYLLSQSCNGTIYPGAIQPDLSTLTRESTFEVIDSSDAFITLAWSIKEECFKVFEEGCQTYPDGILLEVLGNGERIYSDIIYDANGLLTDSYRHFVGPDSAVDYTLNLFIRGNGEMSCTSLTTSCRSELFQLPQNFIASDTLHPGRVELSWVNKSQLSSNILIFRERNGDSTLIAALPGTIKRDTLYSFVDEVAQDNPNNLNNGFTYNYCIQTFNDQLDRVLPELVCDEGSTKSINLNVSSPNNRVVNLAWSDVSTFGQRLTILRDGELIATLDSIATTFVDRVPTFGIPSSYQISVLNEADQLAARATATIELSPVGLVSGFVRTPTQVGIANIPVVYSAAVAPDTLRDTVYTDYLGYFEFTDVFFGRRSIFEVRPIDVAGFNFDGQQLRDTLANEEPLSRTLHFTARQNYPIATDGSISVDTITTVAGLDSLFFGWSYQSSGNLRDTLHFQLFREGQLIDITDDQSPVPLQMVDTSGSGGYIYQYRIVAYGFKGDSIVTGSRVLLDTMPMVTAPSSFQGIVDYDVNSDAVMTMVWQHESSNIDGFRLYRDMSLLAVLGPDDRFFYDYYAEPGRSYDYLLTAYRKANEGPSLLESVPSSAGPLIIPALQPASVLTLTPEQPNNAMLLNWSWPSSAEDFDNVTGFLVSRNGQPIKTVLKQGMDYSFRDYKGVPGMVTYSVQPFLSTPDTIFIGPSVAESADFPTLSAPQMVGLDNAIPGTIKVEIDGVYSKNNANFDGFLLTANNQPFDTLKPFESLSYYTPNIKEGQAAVNIEVKAFRHTSGATELSDPAAGTSSVASQSNLSLEAPTQFDASCEVPMHVRLQWQYPDYIFSTFYVYRDGVLLDTMPNTARSYYDYTAEPGVRHLYSLQANFEGSLSPVVYTTGQRRGTAYLHGQVLSGRYTNDRNSIMVALVDENNGDQLLLRTFTDSSGYFRLAQLHDKVGTGNWKLLVDGEGGSHKLASVERGGLTTGNRTVLFRDNFEVASVPPLPRQDSFALVTAFQLHPFPEEQAVVTSYSLSEGKYDGAFVSRGLTELDALEISANKSTFYMDSTGISGASYPYVSSPYLLKEGRRLSEAEAGARSRRVDYPTLPSVRCLSAIPNLNYRDNTVKLQWSHNNDKVAYYEVRRNGLPVKQTLRGDSLAYVDTQGKPDQTYQYEVRAVRISNGRQDISQPKSITVTFPEVARPVPLTATPVADSNAVRLNWSYNGNVVSGFRIFRDEIPVADVPFNARSYYDTEGFPNSTPTYSVVALLSRENMVYQSRPTTVQAQFPSLLPPNNLQAVANTTLGSAVLSFDYSAAGVSQFKITRSAVGEPTENVNTIFYNYNGQVQTFEEVDKAPKPGVTYTYNAVAVKKINGNSFESEPAMVQIIYPRPPDPQGLGGTTGNPTWVDLNWSMDFAGNVDGFLLTRNIGSNQDSFLISSAGSRTYRDVFFPYDPLPNTIFNYSLRSYRLINGIYYYSNGSSQSIGKLENSGSSSSLFNVTATRGTLPNRARISWEYNGAGVSEFLVYRDEEIIANLEPNEFFLNDSEGVPGRPYVYTVRARVNGTLDSGKSDVGFSKGNGQLEGEVRTSQGNAPVSGASLTASGIVEGQLYTYVAETGNSGQFVIPGMYIGEEPVSYELGVKFRNHSFIKPKQTFNLSPENNLRSNIVFFDTTAYVATGRIDYANTNCSIDSITVRARHILSDSIVVVETGQTDKNGQYSLILNPYLEGLTRIEIVADSIFVRNQGTPNESRVLHNFVSTSSNIISVPVPQQTIINFEDQLSYPVKVAVNNICGFAASSNGRFDVEVSTRDGCFKRIRQTALNGRVTIDLPPLDGLVARVVSAAPLTLENNLIVDYLENRPFNLELAAFHQKNTGFNQLGNFVQLNTDSLIERELVYHKPATITIANEFGQRPTCDPSQPRFLYSNMPYNINLSVTELHQGVDCDVQGGYLIVNNSAALKNSLDTLSFQPSTGDFKRHEFIGGTPNLVPPYRKGINVQYFSGQGDLLAERTIPVVVIGSSPLPGSDIIVDIDEDGQVKLPVMILRDPPGDGSFSSIEEGTTITKSLSNSFGFELGGSVDLETAFTVGGVGAYIDAQLAGGGGETDESSVNLSFTTKQTISTSSASNFVGEDADVLVGLGMAIQYGLSERISFSEESCSFQKIQELSIQPNAIKTDWSYTIGQIKQIAKELKAQADSVRAGSLVIQEAGVEKSPTEAIKDLETRAQNWELVLDYHGRTSLPHHNFCTEVLNATQLWQAAKKVGGDLVLSNNGVPGSQHFTYFADRVNKAKAAKDLFCTDPAVVTFLAQDSVTLTRGLQPLIFNTGVAEKYERSTRLVDYYLDSLQIATSQIPEAVAQAPTSAVVTNVENTTFSAGVTIEKSSTSVRSRGSKFTQKGYLNFSISAGVLLGFSASAGLGLVTEVSDSEGRVGATFNSAFEWSDERYEEITTESTVSYTYTDDDPGDQFSVTSISGRISGHTPYFQLLGGRSSCPPEAGAILRDRFDISLNDPVTQSTFDFLEQRELNPNVPATFYVKLTNLNPFGEQRDLYVYHNAASNENGAEIKINGLGIGGGDASGQAFTFVNAGQSLIFPLTVNRPFNGYEVKNVEIIMRPFCADGDTFTPDGRDTVVVSAYFKSPCSNISIASPGNDWLITRRNPFQADSREAIVLEVGDYDSKNPNLEEIYLEYRRIGDGSGWEIIPFTELEPRYIVNKDSLLNYDMENFGPGVSPRFFFTWDITDLNQKYPDGIYEVRAVAACGTDGVVQSNIIRGQIRRQAGEAFALFEPSDLVWQVGDEISMKVNREIDCATLNEASFIVVNELAQDTVPGTFGCDPTENKLVFLPLAPSSLLETLQPFDNQLLTIKISGLRDEFGNPFPLLRNAQGIVLETLDANGNTIPAIDTFKWDFRVVARDILVQDTFLETTIYQDSEGILNTVLFNTNQGAGATIGFSIPELVGLPWLQATPPNGIVSTSDGLPVQFNINGSLLPVGDTTVVLSVVSNSNLANAGVDNIRIKVNVLARPPYWEVDPSQYSNSMQVVANYQYTQPPGNAPSRDTMDVLSAWIGNEIRGVARIASTQTGQYAAFMLVYGNPEDIGKPLEFRVWDADPGEEYNAYPVDSIFFDQTTLVGSFSQPEGLLVDRVRDRARYIPVNGESDGGGGLTWLSFNNRETDMSVGEQLRELKSLQNGDIIKTELSSAGYVEGVGWISTNGLDSIKAEEGYILYLGGLDDTIRVTGRDATFGPIVLEQGWNQIGYPLQDTVGINDAFNLFNIRDGDRLQTVPQDPVALSLPPNMIAEYNEGLMKWLFAPGMEVMRPNFAYQILVGEAGPLLYQGATTPLNSEPVSDGMGSNSPLFTPADPTTWLIDPSAYPSSMVITSMLKFGGEISLDEGDRVAAYVNGECRGVAPVSFVSALNAYRAPLFVYGAQAGETVEFLMYDASTDRVHLAAQQVSFQPNGIEGSFVEPFVFEAQSMSATYAQSSTYCAADANGTLGITMVSGLQPPYNYEWNIGAHTASLEGLTAGDYTVTITGANGLSFTDTVALENLEVEIPAPQVEWSADNPVCRGTDVVLYAQAPNEEASVRWETADGSVLQETPALMIEGIQAAYTAYAKTMYRGCESEPLEATVQVYQPDASFTVEPAVEVTTETEVQFSPAEATGAFAWDFGDGQSSSLVSPQHQYSLPGHYQAILSRTDLAGCTGQGLYDLWVNAATQVLELPEGELRLRATPNPFGQQIDIQLNLPYSGQYTLELLSISGQALERRQEVWQAGEQTIRLLPDLADGTYLIRLESSKGHHLALPIVKQTPRP
jgi:hypothetical protein